jgi:hypothetical protein
MMEFHPNRAEQPNAGYISAGMDARIVAEIAGLELGTLNAWFHRGWIPGATIGPRGRRRNIDLETAVRVMVIAQLARFGLSPQVAAMAAINLELSYKRLLVVTGLAIPEIPLDTEKPTINADRKFYAQVRSVDFSSEDEIPALLEKYFADSFPSVYAVVNVERLVDFARRVEREWEQRRGGA